jgi:aminoglycoside phosphotransferase family enzyme
MPDCSTITAIIQTVAAAVFLGSVVYDAHRRAKLREQERRDGLINAFHHLWRQSNFPNVSLTNEELSNIYSQRQIDFFNSKLRETGEKWTFPFKRI